MATKCARCKSRQDSDKFFCSSCGFDVVTGTIDSSAVPSEDKKLVDDSVLTTEDFFRRAEVDGATQTAVKTPLMATSTSATVSIVVTQSRAHFDHVVRDHEVRFPNNPAPGARVELSGDEIYVGRTDKSREIYPHLDLSRLSGDMAVSARHAVVKVSANGELSITDLGSTNGTYVGPAGGSRLVPHVEVDLPPEDMVFVGAWTQLLIRVTQ